MAESKYSLIPEHCLELILETHSMTKTLKERVDTHSVQNSNKFDELFKKVDNLKDSQSKNKEELLREIKTVELNGLRNENALKVKMATISGSFGLIMSAIGTWITKELLHK